MRILGTLVIGKKIIILLLLSIVSSCKINSEIAKHNYFNHESFYNDSIKVSVDFLGSMKQYELEFFKRSKLKAISKRIGIPAENAFIACSPEMGGFEMYYFFQNLQNNSENNTTEKVLLEDLPRGIAAYEKRKANSRVVCVVKSTSNNNNPKERAKQFIKRTYIDSTFSNKFSYASVIHNYSTIDNNNLQARHKIKTNPINKINKSGLKGTYLNSINSFMGNNREHDSIIASNEKKKGNRFAKLIEDLNKQKALSKGEDVYFEIADLAKNNQIIILNEDHYFPKHRVFAMKLLDILKRNGFKYLSLEAFVEDTSQNTIPNRNNGFYINEPYFAHFIRKANTLEFVISGHENETASQDREIGQAKNIMKILEKDPKAKIFIYVGHSHLEKEHNKKRWMASHLKELSNINPITINQAHVFADTKESLLMFPRKNVINDTLIKSSADYFLINNLKANLKSVYTESNFRIVNLEHTKFNNKELLIDVYDWDEFYKNKTIVPILSVLSEEKSRKRTLELPVGKYAIIAKTEGNERIVFKEVQVE